MTSVSTTSQIYLRLLNSNNLQNHPIVITPYRFIATDQQILTHEFDVVSNADGLEYGILLFFSPLPQLQPHYRLTIKIRDALGFRFICNRPIILTQPGQVNANVRREQKMFHMILDSNIPTPNEEVQNSALYQFPNVGGD